MPHQHRTPIRSRLPLARLIPAALVTLFLSAPAPMVAASHFTDVPPSHPFYDNINNLAGSGITQGCAPNQFCPTLNVTREQMAAFLNRAAPRMSIAYFAHPLGNTPGAQPAHNAVVASTQVRAIGTEALLIRANFYTITYAGSGTYPCETLYRFRIGNTIVGTPLMYHREIVVPANTWLTKPLSGEYAIVVPAGDHTVSLVYQRITNSCSMFPGNGVLVVQPIPFRWDLGTYGSGDPVPLDMLGDPHPSAPLLKSNGEPVD